MKRLKHAVVAAIARVRGWGGASPTVDQPSALTSFELAQGMRALKAYYAHFPPSEVMECGTSLCTDWGRNPPRPPGGRRSPQLPAWMLTDGPDAARTQHSLARYTPGTPEQDPEREVAA